MDLSASTLLLIPIIKREEFAEIMRQVFDERGDIILEYDEDLFENENQQAFLDAGHFYGL